MQDPHGTASRYVAALKRLDFVQAAGCVHPVDLKRFVADLLSTAEIMQEAGVSNARIMDFLATLNLLTLWTPDYFVENVTPEALPQFRSESSDGYAQMDANDYLVQLRAMLALDVFADGEAAGRPYAESIQADVLVVGVPSDHMVNPAPGKALANAVGARYAEIDSNCGHIGTGCEDWTVTALVNAFLD